MKPLICTVPREVAHSLSDLIVPGARDLRAVLAAAGRLERYEDLLSLRPSESAPFVKRVFSVISASEQAAASAKPLSGLEMLLLRADPENRPLKEDVAARNLLDRLMLVARDKRIAIYEKQVPAATPEGVPAALPDRREGFGPHPVYLFSVAASKGTVRQELKDLLGVAGASRLLKDWRRLTHLDPRTPQTEVALYLDSCNKACDRSRAGTSDKTTQLEDLAATGREFASDAVATLLCARISRKVIDKVALSEGEWAVYGVLLAHNLGSCSGTLGYDHRGRLRMRFYDSATSSVALGSPDCPT